MQEYFSYIKYIFLILSIDFLLLRIHFLMSLPRKYFWILYFLLFGEKKLKLKTIILLYVEKISLINFFLLGSHIRKIFLHKKIIFGSGAPRTLVGFHWNYYGLFLGPWCICCFLFVENSYFHGGARRSKVMYAAC